MTDISREGEPPIGSHPIGDGAGAATLTETRPALDAGFEQPPITPEDQQRIGLVQRIKNWRGTKEILDIKDDIEGTVRHETGDLGEAIESKSKAAWERTTAFMKSERTRKVAKFAIPIAATGYMMKRRASHQKQPSMMYQPKDLYNRFKSGVNGIDTIKLHSPIEIKRS